MSQLRSLKYNFLSVRNVCGDCLCVCVPVFHSVLSHVAGHGRWKQVRGKNITQEDAEIQH
jgi:hypothetical protein